MLIMSEKFQIMRDKYLGLFANLTGQNKQNDQLKNKKIKEQIKTFNSSNLVRK